MAKRMTDTDKWKKPFIRGLQGAYKLLWLYILDECDHAGIWHVDFDVAEIRTGEKFDRSKVLEVFNGRLIPISDGTKFFIPDFIEFQYGTLNEKNRVHNSVIEILLKNKIDPVKLLPSPLQGAKDKDKEKDKDKYKDLSAQVDLLTQYPADMRFQFVAYWTEKGKTGKERWQMEKTWETEKRLARWSANNISRQPPKTVTAKPIEPQKITGPIQF